MPRTLRLDGERESVGEMRDFCRKQNITRESSLCTDGSHGDQAMAGTYVGADDSTSSIHVHSKLTARSARYADERNVGCVYHQRVLFNQEPNHIIVAYI